MQLNITSNMPVQSRIQLCADTELKVILLEGLHLISKDANICKLIDADVDRAAKISKKERLEDAAWCGTFTPILPGLTLAEAPKIVAESLSLGIGCPRNLDAEAIFIFMLCRAYLGSVTSLVAIDRLRDSLLIHEYLAARNMGMPGRSSIHALLNQISAETHDYILDSQFRLIREEGLETSDKLAIDSFSVGGSTSWPTDSRLTHRLLERAFLFGGKVKAFGCTPFSEAYVPEWLKELHSIDFSIACTAGKAKSKGKVKKLYRRFLTRAAKTADRLVKQYTALEASWKSVALPPSRRRQLNEIMTLINESMQAALRIISYAENRVFNEIVLPSTEKFLSLSDASVAYIQKGGREPVIGYKPQLARSGNGFVTAIEIMKGNPCDSARLVPVVNQHVKRTGFTPDILTVDDGYSSRAGRTELLASGVRVVSISGSKGKHITPEEDWDNPEFKQARADRSAVESIIFTLRYKFDLYRFSRRGLEAVTAEIKEKIIAYNLQRMALVRQRLRDAEAKKKVA